MTEEKREQLEIEMSFLKRLVARQQLLLDGEAEPIVTGVGEHFDVVKNFLRVYFDINALEDMIKWHIPAKILRPEYELYCKENKVDALPAGKFYESMEMIKGVMRTKIAVPIVDETGKQIMNKDGTKALKSMRVWEGLRRKGTSGIITVKDSGGE